MKPGTRPKPPRAADPDPLFRFERQTPIVGGGHQTVVVALTRKTLGWLVLSSAAAFGAYQNLGAVLPLLKRLLLP